MPRVDGVVVLSGGTGSAKLLRGLQEISGFTVVVNVADNAWFHGLYVCPDIDTVTYTLAGLADTARGWGVMDDDFKALEQLKRLGAKKTWFNIGDKDMALHVFRTALLKEGGTLTEVTSKISTRLGLEAIKIRPATDDHVETHLVTAEKGELHLQEFWVRDQGRPTPRAVRYVGARQARPTRAVERALSSAGRLIIAPGNPITSIMPILAIRGFRDSVAKCRARKVAISPMVGEGAYSGPAAGLMAARGMKPTSESVAKLYKGLIDVLIIDETDKSQASAIEKMGVCCHISSTLMRSHADEMRLAKLALEV